MSWPRRRRTVGDGHAARRARGDAQRRSVDARPTTTDASTAWSATVAATCERLRAHRHSGYRGTWDSTDQVPLRAVDGGMIPRFGSLDTTDGGDTYRYSGSFDWQRTRGSGATRLTGLRDWLRPQPVLELHVLPRRPASSGDQFHQADHRFVSGVKLSHRRLQKWAGYSMQNTVGVQVRNDDISNVGLYHTEAREQLDTIRQDSVLQTSAGVYGQNETEWRPRLRTLAGLRVDGYRFSVNSRDPVNSGTRRRASSARKAELSSVHSTAPSFTPTPDSVFTATTRAARRSPAIRRPATRRSASRRSCARRAPKSACEPLPFRTCNRACPSGH